ncbi:alpha/beta fold hydrolase [Streptomyces cacaoi]|uniref:Hydrolase n=1 Tax=Streptomyces cacaoi TaxID=1898 RepID=A0A4Y3QSQ2_STRCI|nr:alpha/beta fold hydrolase [Streptomyces cacaoi]NNG87842.1 alpha/beta fold hydrolase [Streptomyces cacaoi]GEB48232.1 hydrolase [Streptomyces cacaoi]
MTAVRPPQTPSPTHDATLRVTPPGHPPVEVVYARRGVRGGEPMLLLHGIGHHWQAWEPVMTALASRYDVAAIDLPGFGASDPLPEGVSYGLDGVVPLLAQACAGLGMDRPHVVGNSLSGLLALAMGLHGHARSVTALAPAGFWNTPERLYAFAVLRGLRTGARALPAPVARRLAHSAAGRAVLTSAIYARPGRRSPDAVLAETRALAGAAGYAPVLAEGRQPGPLIDQDIPDIPVTIGWGDRDRVLLRHQGVRAKRVIPGARLVRLRGCGHVPMNDDPAGVTRIVLDTAEQARG